MEKNVDTDENRFVKACTVEAYKKKVNAVPELVEGIDIVVIGSYLTSILSRK